MNPNLIKKFQLWLVSLIIGFENLVLDFFAGILFPQKTENSGNILIYKIGNIGDIVCAIPAMIAVRNAYPEARITLLTSPGAKGSLGAKELLEGAKFLDDVFVYYSENIVDWNQKKDLISSLKKYNYDLFIQLPDDLASLHTLLRNLFFAKLIKAQSVMGFKIRTIQLFKKTQVDYSKQKTEVESLIDLLKDSGIPAEEIEYDLPVKDEEKEKVRKFLNKKWRSLKNKLIVGIAPGGKRDGNQWPIEKYKAAAEYLEKKYKAKIIILGGGSDLDKAEIISAGLKKENTLVAAGELSLLETYELLKNCDFVIANSTGTIHLAAAAGVPAIGLYSIRDVFGRWFPYWEHNIVIAHNLLDCDYKDEDCISRSIRDIPVEEVEIACDKLAGKI